MQVNDLWSIQFNPVRGQNGRVIFSFVTIKHAQNVTENPLVKFFPPGLQKMTPRGVYRAAPAVLNQTRREPLFVQTGYHHFSRRHLISFIWADVTGGQFRKERRQPVLSFSSCLRVQPSQAFLQQMILEIWESRKKKYWLWTSLKRMVGKTLKTVTIIK